MFGKHLSDGSFPQAARIQSVPAVNFAGSFRPGEHRPSRIHHNHVIAHVEKRRPLRIPFAGQYCSYLRRQVSDSFAGGVNDVPLSILSQTLAAGKVS
jgi:hypothetical protein